MLKFFKGWLFTATAAVLTPKPELPPVTADMKARGLAWRKIDGEFCLVCGFCGGNCGQCGLTHRIGNIPADMQTMIDNLNGGKA